MWLVPVATVSGEKNKKSEFTPATNVQVSCIYTGCPKKSGTIKKLVMHSLQILLSF